LKLWPKASRTENTRAATAYSIDPRSGFGMIAADLTKRQPATTAEVAADQSAAAKIGDRAQAAAARVTLAFGNAADETGRAAKKVTRVAGRTVDATVPPAARVLGGAAAGAARLAEGAAQLAEGAVEALASLFGGGSSAPAPKQGQAEPEPTRQLDAGGRKEEFGAIQQRDDNDRAARVQEIAHSLGVSEAKTEEELKREMMEQMQRSRDRDRGGGISR
jgi:X-X-X-Leu-X-X-Gly heptad repeat protein